MKLRYKFLIFGILLPLLLLTMDTDYESLGLIYVLLNPLMAYLTLGMDSSCNPLWGCWPFLLVNIVGSAGLYFLLGYAIEKYKQSKAEGKKSFPLYPILIGVVIVLPIILVYLWASGMSGS